MLEAAFLLPQSPDPSPRLIPQAIHFVNEVWKQPFVYIKEAIESSVDTGLAYVSVTEAVQAALLANSERPNTPNDWDKTVTISSQLHTPKQNCYHVCFESNWKWRVFTSSETERQPSLLSCVLRANCTKHAANGVRVLAHTQPRHLSTTFFPLLTFSTRLFLSPMGYAFPCLYSFVQAVVEWSSRMV